MITNLKKIIFFGYRPEKSIAEVAFRIFFVFFCLQTTFYAAYWMSYLNSTPIWFPPILEISVPKEFAVQYLSTIVTKHMLYFLGIALIWGGVEFILRLSDIKNELTSVSLADRKNLISRLYNGEIKSFLLPKKNGFLRVLLAIAAALPVTFFLFSYGYPLTYSKLYHSQFYNALADFQSQSIDALFAWSMVSLIVFQITAIVFAINVVLLGLIIVSPSLLKSIYIVESLNKRRKKDV